jgi:hypothetical protein
MAGRFRAALRANLGLHAKKHYRILFFIKNVIQT